MNQMLIGPTLFAHIQFKLTIFPYKLCGCLAIGIYTHYIQYFVTDLFCGVENYAECALWQRGDNHLIGDMTIHSDEKMISFDTATTSTTINHHN